MADADIQQQVMEVLSDPMNLPSTFWDYMVKRWLRDAPVFPISQVFGFSATVAQTATEIATSETTSSASFVDLATVGPTLTGIPDGKYLIIFGASSKNTTAGSGAKMSIDINGGGAADADSTNCAVDQFVDVARFRTKTLANNGSNTITAKYRVTANTGTFANRSLIAIRYGNN